MPRKPYSSPRDWLPSYDGSQFGLALTLPWVKPSDAREEVLRAAAKKQHLLAIGIRTHRVRQAISPDVLAARADLATPTVRNILNGSNWASLAVLYLLADAVSLDLVVVARPTHDDPEDKPAPKT